MDALRPATSPPRLRSASPAVSVVVPCYNGGDYLEIALRSALEQTHAPLEVIVVDDGSTDASADIAAAFGSRVRVLRQANQGESVARNRGIEAARGEWVAFLDADDRWLPTKLERQLASAPVDVVALHTNYFCFGLDDGVVDLSRTPPDVRYSPEHMATATPVFVSSLVVRRDLPVRFPEWTRYGEDLVYTLELSLYGSIGLVPESLTGYRVHDRSQSNQPGVAILWHRTIEEWLIRRGTALSEESRRTIARNRVALLVAIARNARWRRRWDEYWALRRFLAAYRDYPGVAAVTDERIPPQWVFRLGDGLRRLLGTPGATRPHSSPPPSGRGIGTPPRGGSGRPDPARDPPRRRLAGRRPDR